VFAKLVVMNGNAGVRSEKTGWLPEGRVVRKLSFISLETCCCLNPFLRKIDSLRLFQIITKVLISGSRMIHWRSIGNRTNGSLCWNRRIASRYGVRALWLKNPPAIT